MRPLGKKTIDRVKRHARVLTALKSLDDRARRSLLNWAKKDLIAVLVECARLIIKRRVPISGSQLNALRRETNNLNDLLRLGARQVEEKKNVLQKGGLLGALLGPIVSAVLPSVIGSVGNLIASRGGRRRGGGG